MIRHLTSSIADCRVLIVEDEYFLGDDLARELDACGVQVIGPDHELSAAMSRKYDDYDIAIVDINLRGSSIYPIADEFIRIGKPFVFATGYSPQVIPERFRHIPLWEKPYDAAELAAEIAGLCALKPWLRPLHPADAEHRSGEVARAFSRQGGNPWNWVNGDQGDHGG
jgi:DNA-binding NtrC family response regulator